LDNINLDNILLRHLLPAYLFRTNILKDFPVFYHISPSVIHAVQTAPTTNHQLSTQSELTHYVAHPGGAG